MSDSTPTRLVATLESYLSPSVSVSANPVTTPASPPSPALHLLPPQTLTKLRNLGTSRAREMRSLGHSMQVISHLPISAPPPACVKLNDALSAGTCLFPDRFTAMALLPSDGAEAASELHRCVTKYRFVGGVIGLSGYGARGETGRIALDGKGFDRLWEMAQKLKVPVVLREMLPEKSEIAEYTAGLPESIVAPLAAHMHTAHAMSPVPVLRLYLAGVFDRYPCLRLIIANPGALPYLMPRIEAMLAVIPAADKPKRSFLDVWQHNFYLTTADVLDMSSMRALLEQIPLDRVLYASNYPLEERGMKLMTELRQSGFISWEEYEQVAWANAEYLFGLDLRSSPGVHPLYLGGMQSVHK